MTDVASYRTYDTKLMVATVKNPPPSDRRRADWGPGFRSPDWETFNRLLEVLRERGFAVSRDPRHEKNFPSLSGFHRLAAAKTPHGLIEVACEATPIGCGFEFFQEVVTVNRNGGRYDFDKLEKMPYLIRKKFEGAVAAMVAHLSSRGFVPVERVASPVREMPIRFRLGISEGTTAPATEAELSAAAKAFFDDSWNGEYERKRGTMRFLRDETGWPAQSEIPADGRRDRDGNLIVQGAFRLFRDRGGRIARGRVYGGINGMWMVVYGPGQRDRTHLSSLELFSGDPRSMPRRSAKPRPLVSVLDEAVRRQDFERAIVLRDLIAKATGAMKAA
jgi:hypothetical protein